jgi:hypothetical protein
MGSEAEERQRYHALIGTSADAIAGRVSYALKTIWKSHTG